MRSTEHTLRSKSLRSTSTKLQLNRRNLNQSTTQYNNIDLALQTLDNSHSFMLLQSLQQLSPHLLCQRTKLAHLLNHHHLCLEYSSVSLLTTNICHQCLEVYFQHVNAEEDVEPSLRAHLIESLSSRQAADSYKYLLRFTQITPRVSSYRRLMGELRKQKCYLQKVEILQVHENNRKIIAKTDIKRDEQILFIPKAKLITLELTRSLELVEKIYQQRSQLKSPKHTQLAVYLLYEFQKGENSLFYNYLSTLPTDFSRFPINYSQEMLKQLKGTCFIEQVQQKKIDLRKDYEYVISIDENFARFSFDRFVEMRLLVCSRVFGIVVDRIKTDAMVPLADMLNHHLPKQTSWYYCDSSQGFIIQSLKDIVPGTEIFDSYGQKCNSRFLLNYGFTLPANLHNQSIYITILPSQTSSCHFPLNVRLRINRILESKSFEEMMGVLRAAVSKRQDHDLERQQTQCLQSIKQTSFQSIQNQLKAWQLLENLINDRLKEYPTTLAQDKKILQKSEGILFDVITLRMGEKQVFHYYQTMARKIAKSLGRGSKRGELSPYQSYISKL